jgi:hypothetical protein
MGLPPLAHETLTRAPGRVRAASRTWTRAGGLLPVVTVAAAGVLLLLYERLSQTAPITADSANAVLQGRSVASGNVLLSGWTLSGASFYMTDLPFYTAVAAIRGLSPDVAHDVGAVIYTLLVVAACFLARGQARGIPALGRMAVTLLLLVAPAPGEAAELLLLGPFHAGTTLVVLLALLVLDRAGDRLPGAAAVGLLLTLAVFSDALALYVGVVPIIAVTLLRVVRGRGRRADHALLGAALLTVPASLVLMGVVGVMGGFATVPIQGAFARVEDLPHNAALALEGVLVLFGANFFGRPIASLDTLALLVHLAGVAFVLLCCRWAIREWRHGQEPDRVTQVLLVGMAVDVAAYLFSNQAIDLMTSRYLIPFLAFGAVLAGRVGADRLRTVRLRLVGAAVGLAYLAFMALSLRTPVAPSPEAELAGFLQRHHLEYGVATYWQASTVTVESGGRVRVRAFLPTQPQPTAYVWESEGSWYDPNVPGNDARFAIQDTLDPRSVDRGAIESSFGTPSEEFRVGRYEIFVWDRNLLSDLVQ